MQSIDVTVQNEHSYVC